MTADEIRDHNWSIERILVELTAQVAELNEKGFDFLQTQLPKWEPEKQDK